jgi:hypothetical protein
MRGRNCGRWEIDLVLDAFALYTLKKGVSQSHF